MTTGEKIRRFYREHSTGLLGTVIFHLLLLIFLLSAGISRLQERNETELEFAVPVPEVAEKMQEERTQREELRQKTSSEEVQRMLRSIAVNENARSNNRDSRVQEYIDEVTKELEAGNAAGRYAARTDQNYRKDSLQHNRDRQERLLDSLKSTFYSGESSVSYNLPDRYARVLPIPVFKCEFGGKVVVVIQVDRKGQVQKAAAVPEESAPDECLLEVAVDAALRSVFNEKPNTAPLQAGTITYNFVKQ
ncbi:MAG: energy transducer TonB [Culturomica sp.]|jgi:Na+-transporting methylmalonyl-CoA/oxaloacetate decarboxylase gamma subunit|nr:energy transducer TonB [Culturomica sp.]